LWRISFHFSSCILILQYPLSSHSTIALKVTSSAPSAADSSGGAVSGQGGDHEGSKKRKFERYSAGRVWTDASLEDWPENDYRIFVGDLGIDATDEMLGALFTKYPSYQMCRVVRDKRTGKNKGFGFVSFLNPFDCITALREMNGKYCGTRPMKLKKSDTDSKDKGVAMKRLKGDVVQLAKEFVGKGIF
jgi:hypothetical protein